ncbi:cation:proton antiporter [Evtepia sp.]|uniref:cation:proton antiporter n=1 Tax=Evtepia sp. TaxID=2773933 RepID=UPI002A80E260|nr:cation:proton antiporter [Evtepia sp.]MDY4429394.1 cation:proton antiporter [Evtepia sp.]
MQEIPALISDLTAILVLAAITTLLCKKINLPSVLGYILAGFLVGPVVEFIPTIHDMANIEVWSDIGVIFLMFGLGLEFSLHKMAEVGVPGFLSAGIQALGMGIVGFFLGILLGWGTMNSVFLGVMLAMSSTMITMKSIEDMGFKEEKFSDLAMGTLVIEDIIAIFAMVILSTIAVSQSISGLALAERLGILLLYLALWLILGIYLVPTLMKKLVGLMNDEVLLIFSLALCFLMALLAEEIGLSTELGAFLAGSLLAGTVHAERVEHLITPCKNLFGAVFFVSVGFMVQPAMILKYIAPILLLAVVAIVGKLFFLTLGGLAAGQELDVSVSSAAAQTQVGEFSFIIAGLGQSLSVTGAFLYPIIVAVSVVTTFTTPFLLKLAGPLTRLLERILPDKWLAAIAKYSAARQADKSGENKDLTFFLKYYFQTLALYGVLAVGVILLGVRSLLPFLLRLDWGGRRAELVACGMMYLALLFLLPAMLRIKKRYFTALWLESTSNRLLLSILMIFRAGVVILLAVLPAFLIFQVNPLWLASGAIPLMWIVTRSDRLTGHYLEVEARFLANFNERKLAEQFGQGDQAEVHHWLTEQLYVVTLACPEKYVGEGMTLWDHGWGSADHINIIKIIRGKEHINIPEGDVKTRGGDLLVAMGSRRDLENFCFKQTVDGVRPQKGSRLQTLKEYIENQEGIPQTRQLLCCGVSLGKDLPQQGRSIRDSGIKEEWSAFLIGLERDLLPIPNPDRSMTLRTGDLLWVMGSQEMAGKLVRLGLLD